MIPANLRWAVVIVDFDRSRGHEQEGTRRALIVSYEAFHRSGMAALCPISARPPKYPGEVTIPGSHAGQTRDAVILCHQVRIVDLARVMAWEVGGRVQYVSSPDIRRQVPSALRHHFGLDVPEALDGAA